MNRLTEYLFPISTEQQAAAGGSGNSTIDWCRFDVINALYIKTFDTKNVNPKEQHEYSDTAQPTKKSIATIKSKIITFYEAKQFTQQTITAVNPSLFNDDLFIKKFKNMLDLYNKHEWNDWFLKYWNEYGIEALVDIICKCDCNPDVFCGLSNEIKILVVTYSK